MKNSLLAFALITTVASIIGFDNSANAETFGCQANPRIGDTCTKRVSIRLRKVEAEGRDEFDRRFEPGRGWAILDCDTRSGERNRTGEVSGPNCIEVQAGTSTTSSSFVQAQAQRVFETIQRGRVQGGNQNVQAFASLENRARAEFSTIANTASTHQSINRGLQISAWVAVRGGCRTRLPFGGSCVNWGPGGSLDTDIIARLVFVGNDDDVAQIANRYIAEAGRITSTVQSPPDAASNQIVVRAPQWGGLCLDIANPEGRGPQNGASVLAFQCHGGGNQIFQMSGDGTIRAPRWGGLCLDIANPEGRGPQNGALVLAFQCHGGNNQRWSASPLNR